MWYWQKNGYIGQHDKLAQKYIHVNIGNWSLTEEQRQHNGEKKKKTAFSINNAGTEYPYAKRMNLDRFTPFFHKNQLKWIISLNVKCKIITVLEDKTKEILDDFGYGDDFKKKIPKMQSIKEIITQTLCQS